MIINCSSLTAHLSTLSLNHTIVRLYIANNIELDIGRKSRAMNYKYICRRWNRENSKSCSQHCDDYYVIHTLSISTKHTTRDYVKAHTLNEKRVFLPQNVHRRFTFSHDYPSDNEDLNKIIVITTNNTHTDVNAPFLLLHHDWLIFISPLSLHFVVISVSFIHSFKASFFVHLNHIQFI